MLISSIGLVLGALFCIASSRSSMRSWASPPATRHDALEVSRCEARTSETRSPSASLISAIVMASSAPASSFLSSALSSRSGIRAKSISPWLSDFSGLPPKSSWLEVLGILLERAVLALRRGEARQAQQFLAALKVLPDAFLDHGAERVPDLGECFRLLLSKA